MKTYRVALAGNPNSGKTTLFNELTGSSLYVGNWPGVTIEKKEGKLERLDLDVTLIDLPGVYSLAPYSLDEIVSRDFLIGERPDLILNIIDATNIERNLYLTTQLMELGIPMVGALNMVDVVEKKGLHIDEAYLSKEFGFPFTAISAQKRTGIDELLALVKSHLVSGGTPAYPSAFPAAVDKVVENMGREIDAAHPDLLPHYPKTFRDIKLIEKDHEIAKLLGPVPVLDELVNRARGEISEIAGRDIDSAIADYRYRFITERVARASYKVGKDQTAFEKKLDKVLMNRFVAIPIFLVFMFIIYYISINLVGEVTTGWIEDFIGEVAIPGVTSFLTSLGVADWLISMITEGAITGVGAVLAFIPQITVLFIFITVLEDSGYMARVAFMMDRIFRRFGLSGKSFIPMVIGLGCSVPGIMATRTLENERERKLTIILVPFISCGAKMPLYVMLASAFFPGGQALVVFSVYLISLVAVFISGMILAKTVFKGEDSGYLLELPPYRLPVLKSTAKQVWQRVKEFIVRAGTIIFAVSVVLWFLQNFGTNFQMIADPDRSILATFGKFIAPIFTPLGFGNWIASVSLLSGIAAKEMIVSTMTLLTSSIEGGFTVGLQSVMSPLSAYSYILFVLLSSPCFAALSTMKKELGSWRLFAFGVAYQIGLAYLVSMIFYQVGNLLVSIV